MYAIEPLLDYIYIPCRRPPTQPAWSDRPHSLTHSPIPFPGQGRSVISRRITSTSLLRAQLNAIIIYGLVARRYYYPPPATRADSELSIIYLVDLLLRPRRLRDGRPGHRQI